MAALALNEVVDGRGHRLVWTLQLQVLRELAQHAGHAHILSEQIVDRRSHGVNAISPRGIERTGRPSWGMNTAHFFRSLTAA